MATDLVLRALAHVWKTLESLHLPAAVMGGIAVAAWKHVRATHDVDLLVGIGTLDLDLLLQQFAQAELRPKRQPPILQLGQLRIVQLLYEPTDAYVEVQVDLLIADSEYQDQALARRVPVSLPGVPVEVAVLSCEDLILHKLLAGRLIDRADAAALLRANRDTLDLEYLMRWVRELSLASELTEIWEEALPGEPAP